MVLNDIDTNPVQHRFNNLVVKNVDFSIYGYLMQFRHKIASGIQIKNCIFEYIENGLISVMAYSYNVGVMKTMLEIQNMTVFNASNVQKSFIEASVYSELTISNSQFDYLTTIESGSVVTSMDQDVNVIFINSSFSNNTAVSGGVMYSINKGCIECHSCIISHNFAINSGVVWTKDGANFKFFDSYIANNHAYSSAVTEIYSTLEASIIDG